MAGLPLTAAGSWASCNFFQLVFLTCKMAVVGVEMISSSSSAMQCCCENEMERYEKALSGVRHLRNLINLTY